MINKSHPQEYRPLLLDYMALQSDRTTVNAKSTATDKRIKRLVAQNRRLNKNRRARIKRRLTWYFDYCEMDKRTVAKFGMGEGVWTEHKNELILEFADHLIFEYELRELNKSIKDSSKRIYQKVKATNG